MPYQGEEDCAPDLGGSQACGHTCREECLQPQPLLTRSPSSSGAQTSLCSRRNSRLLPPEWLLCLPRGKAAGEVVLCKWPMRSLWCVSEQNGARSCRQLSPGLSCWGYALPHHVCSGVHVVGPGDTLNKINSGIALSSWLCIESTYMCQTKLPIQWMFRENPGQLKSAQKFISAWVKKK